MKTWEAAVEVLRETGNDAVMLGDTGLLDSIHKRAGLREGPVDEDPMRRWKRVLDNLSRSPGPFVAKLTHDGRQYVRVFRLSGGVSAAERIAADLHVDDECLLQGVIDEHGQDVADALCKILKERGLDLYDGFVVERSPV